MMKFFRLLKTASLPYELKDRLLNQFINAKNSHELMNILHHQDKELRGRFVGNDIYLMKTN